MYLSQIGELLKRRNCSCRQKLQEPTAARTTVQCCVVDGCCAAVRREEIEQIVDVPVPQILEHSVEVIKVILQEQCQ